MGINRVPQTGVSPILGSVPILEPLPDLGDRARATLDAEIEIGVGAIRAQVAAYGKAATEEDEPAGPRPCKSCSKEISSARLRAIPLAVLCRNCQEKKESRRYPAGGSLGHVASRAAYPNL